MNGADDGPRCSLISYVVPPGLSRAPIIEPANFIPYTAPIEGVSARAPSVSNRTTNFGKLVASSSPPPSPKAERRSRVRSASETTPTCVAQPEQVVSKPNKKLLNKSNEEAHPKKSCLTKTTQSVIPARLNLRKKTVAFGKTVNVSQTIEGTSRLSKQKQAMNKSMQSKEVVATNTENKENEPEESSGVNKEQTALLDILKDVKSSLDVLKARDEERADELRNIRRLVDERGKEVDLLRGMFADYLGKDCPQSSDSKVYSLTKREEDRYRPNANRDKFSRNPSPQCRSKRLYSPPPRNATKVDPQRDSDSEEIDGITFEEFKRLLTTNPTLRQFVLDIRHEENDLRTGYADRRRDADKFESSRWRDSPKRTNRVRETAAEQAKHREEVKRREPRGAKFTEKVTVERSIRCSPPELAQYSVDTRRYIEDQILEEEPEDIQSMYRPGESVSYYPERLRQRGNAGDLNDSDVEDERTGRKYGDMNVEERRRQRRVRRTDRCQDY